MNRVISAKKLTKKDTNSRQTSIQVALNFLETQKKTSSAPPLSVCQVASNYGVAEQTLCDAIAKGLFLLQNQTHKHNTRINRLTQLENKNKNLREYIQQLEHPGTTSLALIMNYPQPQQQPAEKKPQA
ncbi:8738_t:CDS:2 [Dentiscutata erythropus]|uniref:8738_t:CDS:1 n=1 Tax=Dentiscutata erythropus TaxID=1348616 RepID=A0A9N9EQ58_9GLOM|nr:8738_t:CDS:2 [Dentiscutata erythropus]